MYQKEKNPWLKHLDFMLLDVVCLQLAYVMSYIIRYGMYIPYTDKNYRNLGIIIMLVQICLTFFLENYKDILRRSPFEEMKMTAVFVTSEVLAVFCYLFVTQTSRIFSRAVLLQFWVLGIVVIYFARLMRKRTIHRKMEDHRYLQSMILITPEKYAQEMISGLTAERYSGYYVKGIILPDQESKEKTICDIPVVADQGSMFDYLRENVVDEVFLYFPDASAMREQIVEACNEMGITCHLRIGERKKSSHRAIIENVGDYMVITSSISFADPRQLMLKRGMDILGGIVGIILTALITVIFAPIIYIQSPGPIFFSQERVGRNGRKFKIYKFRSMYPDAEERKKELMAQNKMQGLMFKMDNDPRIIPIGHFMRKTSLDEFPQFFNVLKGDMSLVGTRPPTVDEYEQYEQHHKARLAAKPGLTGMWQVSGRSDIVDFEEVVELDKKYITGWNIGLDFKILFQTVKIVITGKDRYNLWEERRRSLDTGYQKEKIKSIADFLYLTVFALLLGYYFLVTTTFPIEWRENFPAYLRVLLIVVILIKLTYVEIYDLKEVLFAALISLCFLAVWIRTSDPLVLNTLLLILGSKGTSFEKILKVYVAVTAGLLAITMAAALLGFTENLVYIQEGRSPRIAFGICYPTDFSAHVLYSLLAYGYLRRERIHYVELALMAGAGVFVYVFCDARVNTVCILVATGTFLYNKIRHKRAEKQGKIYVMNRIWSWLLAMSTVICALFMTLMTVFYSSENPLTAFLNRLINFRLSYGKKGVDLFGFSLLGQYIPMIGNGDP